LEPRGTKYDLHGLKMKDDHVKGRKKSATR
jgi:hypothetical protein